MRTKGMAAERAALGDLGEPTTASLPCGLRVVHMRIPGAVAVGASLGVDVGSADEPDEWAGISHFLEHLVFRGTNAYADSMAIGRAIEAVGGDFNAFTGKSYTQYICSAPLEHRRLVSQIPAELVVRPLFRQTDVDDERPVVLREIGLEEDSAGRRMTRALEQSVWPRSPMARPIIGRPETLQQIGAEDVRHYWSAHYVPSKATFAIVGDLSLEEALELAGEAVGNWQASTVRAPAASAPALETDGPIRVETMPHRQETALALGVPVGPWRSIDQGTTAVLATLAGEGEGSLLIRSLVRRRGLLLGGGALAWLNRDAGALGLSGSTRPAGLVAAAKGLLGILRQLQQPPKPEDFRRAVGYARGEILRQWLRPLDVAIQLCHQALMGDGDYGPLRDLRDVEAVTPEKLRASAARDFSPERLRIAVAGPEADVAALEALLRTGADGKWAAA